MKSMTQLLLLVTIGASVLGFAALPLRAADMRLRAVFPVVFLAICPLYWPP